MFTIAISEDGELESHQLIFIVVTEFFTCPCLRNFASADPSTEILTWLLLFCSWSLF